MYVSIDIKGIILQFQNMVTDFRYFQQIASNADAGNILYWSPGDGLYVIFQVCEPTLRNYTLAALMPMEVSNNAQQHCYQSKTVAGESLKFQMQVSSPDLNIRSEEMNCEIHFMHRKNSVCTKNSREIKLDNKCKIPRAELFQCIPYFFKKLVQAFCLE